MRVGPVMNHSPKAFLYKMLLLHEVLVAHERTCGPIGMNPVGRETLVHGAQSEGWH